MSIIRETFFVRNFHINTSNPYYIANKIMKELSEHGKFVLSRNLYETDGPTKRIDLQFSVEEHFDNVSLIKFVFEVKGVEGEKGFLDVKMRGLIEKNMGGIGFMSNLFGKFYESRIFPSSKKKLIAKFKKDCKIFEKIIRESPIP